ncbi:MAG: hypothetical protein AB202_00550 [Parcubacteria bacterium C7867-007]|nr:MAG: hypothetical protein AB202_00550 [Parcubacteria bacterium C7867-007]
MSRNKSKQGVSPKRPHKHPQKTAKRIAVKMARKAAQAK